MEQNHWEKVSKLKQKIIKIAFEKILTFFDGLYFNHEYIA